ncbi:MAG TPA: ATP-binding protein [Xanthobacteraceae bacterium]
MLADTLAAESRSFVATLPQITEIDRWVEQVCAEWSTPEAVVFRARVCLAELAANLLEHGRAQADWDEISITLRPGGPTLEIEISDTGRAFDPSRAFDPAANPGKSGGHGLRLLHAYTAAMTYRREGGRNILWLRVAPVSRSPAPDPWDQKPPS